MDVEVLRPEFDRGGYDVVITKGSVSRFIQLKTTLINSKTKDFKVSLSLSQKPNPCVIWILVDDNLDFLGFRWFGSDVGKNFPDISAKRLAKHTKGDASGQKAIRTGHRVLRPIDFVKLTTIEEVVEKLFQ